MGKKIRAAPHPGKVPLNPMTLRAIETVPLNPFVVRAIETVTKGKLRDPKDPLPVPVEPCGHYVEFMSLKGWLDLDLNDPDLAALVD